ncbi:MAG: dihydroorotase [Bdellovibrionota bacterium]|jgi:dihydroorotase
MILIKNGKVIDPATAKEGEFDVLIEGDKIKDLQKRGVIPDTSAEKIIDAKGKLVVPGLIDLHVHLREPGFEWKETVATGARAAVAGGFTSICCMPNTSPTNDCAEVTKAILEKAELAKAAKVLPLGAVSIARKGEKMAPFSELFKAGCVAFSDDGSPIYNAGLMRRALEWCLMLGARIHCHEEDLSLSSAGVMNESALSMRIGLRGWAAVAEEVMIARDIELARYVKGKVHICHISTARGVELVRRAKNDGIDVTAEVTPHHLVLTEEAVANYDVMAKMSPPLREMADVEALRDGLKDGTIDAVASDHAPHEADSKIMDFESASMGVIGLQSTLPLLLEFAADGVLPLSRVIEAMTAAPAKVLGRSLGSLKIGQAADITIIDPNYKWSYSKDVILSKSYNSPFLSRTMKGIADTVLIDGRIVLADKKMI